MKARLSGVLALLLLGPQLVFAQSPAPTKTSTSSAKEVEGDDAAPVELVAPRASARMVGPNPAYLGQLVEIEVELVRDNRGPNDAVFFPELQVPGAITVASKSVPPPEERIEEGVHFLVQKRRYLVFPQQEGRLDIPPLKLSVFMGAGAGTGAGAGEIEVEVTTQALTLQADLPRGASKRLPLVAREVTLERKIDGDLDHLRVGDAFSVSLKLRAEQTDPVLLPELELPELERLTRYPGQASTQGSAERGTFHAERVDQATYVAQDWGPATLPRVSVLWLDPTTGEYSEATAPALSFRARVNPKLGASCLGRPESAVKVGGVTGLLVLLGLALLRLVRRVSGERRKRALVPKTKEERLDFAALKRAARSENAAATLTALYRWMKHTAGAPTTLAQLRRHHEDPELRSTTSALEERVARDENTGPSSALPSTALIRPLERLRRVSRRKDRSGRLPQLNLREGE